MSRAKRYINGDIDVWFDYKGVATPEQLDLLADITDQPIDDLLDAGLSQKEIARQLFAVDGLIPEHVLERRRKRLQEQKDAPACRWCALHALQCEGRSTRHHYVPRWIMLLLENYQAYAPRSICTIPVCLGRHRDLHMRGGTPKSIVACLTDHERQFACRMLDELKEEHPVVYDLMLHGDESSYEAQLVRDYASHRLTRAPVASKEVSMGFPPDIKAVGVASA
jgi:hypothetical protein